MNGWITFENRSSVKLSTSQGWKYNGNGVINIPKLLVKFSGNSLKFWWRNLFQILWEFWWIVSKFVIHIDDYIL
jgi:hypothetical protein